MVVFLLVPPPRCKELFSSKTSAFSIQKSFLQWVHHWFVARRGTQRQSWYRSSPQRIGKSRTWMCIKEIGRRAQLQMWKEGSQRPLSPVQQNVFLVGKFHSGWSIQEDPMTTQMQPQIIRRLPPTTLRSLWIVLCPLQTLGPRLWQHKPMKKDNIIIDESNSKQSNNKGKNLYNLLLIISGSNENMVNFVCAV